MLYYVEVFTIALLVELVFQLVIRKKEFRLTKQGVGCEVFFIAVISGLVFRKYVYLCDSGIYFFLDNSIKNSIMALVGLSLIDLLIIVVLSLFYVYIRKQNKDSLASIGEIKILPVVSMKWLSLSMALLYIILGISDTFMPQYGYWKEEDINIWCGNTHMHEVINRNYMELGYPLANSLEDRRPNDKIVLVIGDSFIWGDGSSNANNLWWKMLQRKVTDEGYEDCRIVAVGYCGASTQDQLNWIENTTMLSDINPDMIIFGYVTNDAQYTDEKGNMIPSSWSPDSYIQTSGVLKTINIFFPNIAYVIDNDLQERKIKKTDLSAENKYDYDTWEKIIVSGDYLDRYYTETLHPLAETMKSKDIPYCFITTPNTPSYERFHERYRNVLVRFEQAGIPIYDCLEDFVEKHADEEEYYKGINPVNAHPGVATNSYIASYVFNILRCNYPISLGNKTEKNIVYSEVSVNDWYPDSKLNPVCNKDGTISFVFSDSWDDDKYLYLPMFEKSVKICFETPVDLSGKRIIVRDESNQKVENIKIRVSYISDVGYEILSNEVIRCRASNCVCNLNSVTSLNISGQTDGIEHVYTISFE